MKPDSGNKSSNLAKYDLKIKALWVQSWIQFNATLTISQLVIDQIIYFFSAHIRELWAIINLIKSLGGSKYCISLNNNNDLFISELNKAKKKSVFYSLGQPDPK